MQLAIPMWSLNLNKVRNPFNNNSLALAVAENALEDEAFIEQCRKLNQ